MEETEDSAQFPEAPRQRPNAAEPLAEAPAFAAGADSAVPPLQVDPQVPNVPVAAEEERAEGRARVIVNQQSRAVNLLPRGAWRDPNFVSAPEP